MKLIGKTIFGFFNLANRGFYKFIIMPMKKAMFAHCGKDTFIGPNSFFSYSSITIGNNVSIGANATFISSVAKIHIKDHVMIGPGVTVVTGDHRMDEIGAYMKNVSRKLPENDKDVIIEEDVWIGANATFLKGVTVGKGSVVAACSLVTSDVEPYCIYGGNPARKLKNRFTPDQIAEHERILASKEKVIHGNNA